MTLRSECWPCAPPAPPVPSKRLRRGNRCESVPGTSVRLPASAAGEAPSAAVRTLSTTTGTTPTMTCTHAQQRAAYTLKQSPCNRGSCPRALPPRPVACIPGSRGEPYPPLCADAREKMDAQGIRMREQRLRHSDEIFGRRPGIFGGVRKELECSGACPWSDGALLCPVAQQVGCPQANAAVHGSRGERDASRVPFCAADLGGVLKRGRSRERDRPRPIEVQSPKRHAASLCHRKQLPRPACQTARQQTSSGAGRHCEGFPHLRLAPTPGQTQPRREASAAGCRHSASGACLRPGSTPSQLRQPPQRVSAAAPRRWEPKSAMCRPGHAGKPRSVSVASLSVACVSLVSQGRACSSHRASSSAGPYRRTAPSAAAANSAPCSGGAKARCRAAVGSEDTSFHSVARCVHSFTPSSAHEASKAPKRGLAQATSRNSAGCAFTSLKLAR